MTKGRCIRNRRALFFAVALLPAMVSSCSSSRTAASPPTTTQPAGNPSTATRSTSSSTTPTIPTPTTSKAAATVELVKARWLEYFRVVATATTNPNPTDPKLLAYMTGPALGGFQGVLRQRVKDGIIVRYSNGSDRHVPRVLEVSGTQATISDCWEDRAVQVQQGTGKVVNSQISTYLVHGTMVLEGSAWKTFSYQLAKTWNRTIEASRCVA